MERIVVVPVFSVSSRFLDDFFLSTINRNGLNSSIEMRVFLKLYSMLSPSSVDTDE